MRRTDTSFLGTVCSHVAVTSLTALVSVSHCVTRTRVFSSCFLSFHLSAAASCIHTFIMHRVSTGRFTAERQTGCDRFIYSQFALNKCGSVMSPRPLVFQTLCYFAVHIAMQIPEFRLQCQSCAFINCRDKCLCHSLMTSSRLASSHSLTRPAQWYESFRRGIYTALHGYL